MKLLFPGIGLLYDQYWEAVEKILNSVTTFTSQASGSRFTNFLSLELEQTCAHQSRTIHCANTKRSIVAEHPEL